jgi:hypothetical protein
MASAGWGTLGLRPCVSGLVLSRGAASPRWLGRLSPRLPDATTRRYSSGQPVSWERVTESDYGRQAACPCCWRLERQALCAAVRRARSLPCFLGRPPARLDPGGKSRVDRNLPPSARCLCGSARGCTIEPATGVQAACSGASSAFLAARAAIDARAAVSAVSRFTAATRSASAIACRHSAQTYASRSASGSGHDSPAESRPDFE